MDAEAVLEVLVTAAATAAYEDAILTAEEKGDRGTAAAIRRRAVRACPGLGDRYPASAPIPPAERDRTGPLASLAERPPGSELYGAPPVRDPARR